MNPYIIPFEKLKSKDLEIVGGKNASIGEMISTLSNLGVSVPGGFATTSHAYRDFLAQDALGARIADTLATLDVDDVERLAIVGKQIRGWMLATPFPRRLQRGSAASVAQNGERRGVRRCGALLGHRGGFAGGLFRGAARDLPQRAWRGAPALEHARGVRVAVQRPGHRLPRAQQLRPQRRGTFRRRAAHGAQRPGRRRRDVHARHGLRLPRRRVLDLLLRARRDRGAGRGESGRVLRLQAGAARRAARDPPQEPRPEGHQDDLRRARHPGARAYGRGARRGSPAILHRRSGHHGALEAGAHHRGALRHADGHRVGQGRPDRQDLHLAGAARDGAKPRRAEPSSASP